MFYEGLVAPLIRVLRLSSTNTTLVKEGNVATTGTDMQSITPCLFFTQRDIWSGCPDAEKGISCLPCYFLYLVSVGP